MQAVGDDLGLRVEHVIEKRGVGGHGGRVGGADAEGDSIVGELAARLFNQVALPTSSAGMSL